MTTGERIKHRRLEVGLSQRQLADATRRQEGEKPIISYAYISRLEADDRTASISALIALAEPLETSALWLLTGRSERCPVCLR
jgi:transcriptional regulator with XRE-family HTH domain